MNETIAQPRLVELIAATASVDQTIAEQFVKAFFTHAEEVLAQDGTLTIEGLGTFSRTDDTDNPIAFKPDEMLAEAINQPFAMFEPVAVGDVSLTEDENESSSSETPSAEPPVDKSPTETLPSPQPQMDLTNSQAEGNENAAVTSTPDKPETPECTQPEPELHTSQIVIDEPCDEPDYYNPDYSPEPSRKTNTIVVSLIFGMIGLIAGIAIGYYGKDKIHDAFNPHDIESDTADTIASPLDDETGTEYIVPAVTDTVVALQPASIVKHEPVYDTVSPDRFLTTMARHYYGRMEYWVFIYEANSDILGNPNRIKPGTKVVIPDLADFSSSETPEQTLARAKRLGREIYQRFE